MADGRVLEVRITGDSAGLSRALRTAGAEAQTFGSRVGTTAADATRKFGAAAALAGKVGAVGLVAGLALSIRSAANFEQTMNVLQATTGASAARMKDVSALAIKLGGDIHLPATSARDAGEAMNALAQGGLNVKDTMGAARGVLLLSAAAQISNSEAADITAKTLKAFNVEGSHAAEVANDLAGAAKKGASVTEMGLALKASSAVAHQFGLDIGDTTTALTELSQAGITGSDAGTSLKQMLMSLTPTGKPATAAMAKLGVSVKDAHGNFLPFNNIIGQFRTGLDKLTPYQQQFALKTIFGSDATRAANVILGNGADKFNKLRGEVTRAGQAQELANAQTKGFNGALNGFLNVVETMALQLGTQLLPVATQFVRWLTNELPAAVAAASNAIGRVVDVITSMFDFITGNIGSVRQLGIAIGIAAGVVGGLTIAIGLLNIVIYANPIVLMAVAVTALIAGLVLLYERVQVVHDVVDSAFAAIRQAAEVALGYITSTIIPAALRAWDEFRPRVVAALQGAVSAVQQGAADIRAAITAIATFVRDHWDDIWSVLGPIVRAAFEVVRTTIQTTLNVIGDVIRGFSDILHGRWGAAWGELKNVVGDVLSGVVSTVGSILRGLAGSAGAAARIVGREIAAGIKAAVGYLEGLAGDLAGRIRAAAGQAAGSAFAYMRQVGFAIADGVISGIGNLGSRLVSTVGGMARHAVGGVLSAIGAQSPSRLYANTVGAAIGDGVRGGAAKALEPLGGQLGTQLAAIARRVAAATKANAPTIASAFKDWASRAKDAFDKEMDGLDARMKAQLDKAKAGIDAWKAKLTPAEVRVNAEQAMQQLEQLQGALNQAWDRLKALPAEQEKAMHDLLAQQQANMAQLNQTLTGARDSAILSGDTFQRHQADAANNSLAQTLVHQQQIFDAVKQGFDNGLNSQEQFVAAARALDDAKAAAAQDSNAQQLLDDYNTWQEALSQQADAGQAITDQQAADAQAQADLQAQQNADRLQAEADKNTALEAMLSDNLQATAAMERAARDAAAAELNTDLVARFNRIQTHLNNVRDATDASFAELARHATTGGGNLIEALSTGIRNAMPTLTSALTAIATSISHYLQVQSPTEKGPMSTLDTWWTGFAATLVGGLDTKLITDTISGAVDPRLNPAVMRGTASPTGAVAMPGSSSRRGPITIIQHFGPGTDPTEVAQKLSADLRRRG